MNAILVKMFATALALSQVATEPGAVKTQFDPVADQSEVVRLVQAGCAHVRKVFDIEAINLDDLITTAMDDPQAMGGSVKALHGLKFDELFTAYRQFCKNETVEQSPVDIGEVIAFYNKAAADLPDHTKLKNTKLPGLSVVLDGNGERFADLGEASHRRLWVDLKDIPGNAQKAFVSAEDKRFFSHKGIDERGMIRAFVGNLAQPGRPQGGSTITQQVAKNLLVGDDVTYERKIREIIVASRLEQTFSKQEILALYLNSIYLGRGSWGIEMAAKNYFGKSAKDLTLAESALLAGLTKGPNYFSPDRHPDRAHERVAYVLGRMQEDGAIGADDARNAQGALPRLVAYDRSRRDSGFYFVDQVGHEAKAVAGIDQLTASSYTVHSTLRPDLQRATEAALQEGLARYEIKMGRTRFSGAEANLDEAIARIEAARRGGNSSGGDAAVAPPRDAASLREPQKPAWQEALEASRPALYDVHWPVAVVLALPGRKSDGTRVGLADGRILPLSTGGTSVRKSLKLHDVIFVQVADGKGKAGARAELRVRPGVQGAALILENKTGKILAMAGGFSYPLSQLNRTSQAQRQPGSAIKPITYLAALKAGLQPNTLVLDEPITLSPIDYSANPREQDYWSPKDADGWGSGAVTLRRGLENSKNLVTARLLDGAISGSPEDSLARVCDLAKQAQIYKDCVKYYPFVLGAQPVRMIDLAAFYAAVANEGLRPTPYAIESIEQDGRTVFHHPDQGPAPIGTPDPATFYQLKTMLQGVVERGTARPIRQLAPYVAGKTGTTENENDAWFVGLTNEVTVAVWVGYDNADGQRRSLGSGETGAKVAIPIFEPIIQAVWSSYAVRTALAGPSPQASRNLVDLPIELSTGDRLTKNSGRGFIEHFRVGTDGQVDDTQYRLVSREEAFAYRDNGGESWDEMPWGGYGRYDSYGYNGYGRYDGYGGSDRNSYGRNGYDDRSAWRTVPQQQPRRGLFGGFFGWGEEERPRPRRVDPDYPWARRGLY